MNDKIQVSCRPYSFSNTEVVLTLTLGKHHKNYCVSSVEEAKTKLEEFKTIFTTQVALAEQISTLLGSL